MHQNKAKRSEIPKYWFFFNPNIVSNNKIFYKISNKIGIVFFYQDGSINNFFRTIGPYIEWCKKEKIKFVIPYSSMWLKKCNAFGVMLELQNKKELLFARKNKLKKNYFLFAKVHSLKEAILAKDQIDIIFLTPVFKTNSFPQKRPLTNYIFISLCFFLKEKVIFALGGVTSKNFRSIKNNKLHGFGAISFFRE